ncbi:hypothetical protein J1605_008421 [Eschrichtius robustus]|uniref:Uncharacterized protein n=1 Tax=Eschrichtius robustus TaxID=9764 RepID=A0AB34H063_ESCRO|nr:hypothetical protein J1605_008421 [Eschrichtius robustus]
MQRRGAWCPCKGAIPLLKEVYDLVSSFTHKYHKERTGREQVALRTKEQGGENRISSPQLETVSLQSSPFPQVVLSCSECLNTTSEVSNPGKERPGALRSLGRVYGLSLNMREKLPCSVLIFEVAVEYVDAGGSFLSITALSGVLVVAGFISSVLLGSEDEYADRFSFLQFSSQLSVVTGTFWVPPE